MAEDITNPDTSKGQSGGTTDATMEDSPVTSDPPTLSTNGVSHGSETTAPKRTRVLLSCAPCRASKLKCDRAVPCTQCLKKARPSLCTYAPKPVRNKQPKGMTARLKRLEGMVRDMLDEEGNLRVPPREQQVGEKGDGKTGEKLEKAAVGKVVAANGVRGGSTAYVGATHFMAMLDDIEDLKSYFDDDATENSISEPSPDDFTPEVDSPEMLMMNTSPPRSKQDLLALLPPRQIADRLVMRWFSSHSASQHIVHKPTFVKRYTAFWTSPAATIDMDWLALLFMVLSLGIFYSSFSAPHELANDATTLTPTQRFRQYRAAAAHALSSSSRSGGYSSPATSTCAPFLLYVESEFLINRRSHMNCYLLAGVCIRIMLKMGLHRDPSKLPGAQISAYDGEMRRRIWNLAIQIDLMMSFHLGLPSMIHGIESDTSPPRNLLDEDFDENTVEMPPERSAGDYTHMSYPIFKASICRVFGKVARMAHALTMPTYGEVMAVDALLVERWAAIPSFMKVRPLNTCIADPPFQVIQRFGIAALYQKARCVLHRQFLVEKDPRPEHDYSRRTCLLGALALLEYQSSLSEATKPGGMLSGNGWFVSSLAIHDFLLAATIVYLVVQDEHYDEPGGDFDFTKDDITKDDTPLPNKQQLTELLRRSHRIWTETAAESPEVKKAPAVLEVMLRQIGTSRGEAPIEEMGFAMANMNTNEASSSLASTATFSPDSQVPFSRSDFMEAPMTAHPGIDATWLPEEINAVDWTSLETAIRASANFDTSGTEQWLGTDVAFDQQISFADADFMEPSFHPGT